MALDRKLITITAPTAAGVQTYSGVPFPGKVVLFLCACAAADGTHSSLIACCGMATGSGTGNQWVLAAASTEFNGGTRLAASDAGQSHADTHCVCMLASGAPTIMKEANFDGWTSDGFRLNWTVADATANLKLFALVLGGTDLTNVKVGRFNPPTAAGTQALTGFGFQPDCFGVVAPTSTSTNLTGENANDAHFNFGAAVRGAGTAVAAQATAGYFENGGAAAMDVQTGISTTLTIYTNSSATASNPQYRGSVQSFDTDGVTLNWAATTTTANRAMWYFAFKGPQFQIVADTQPATNSTKSTPVAFPPKALILAGTHLTADGTSIAAGTQGYVTGMTDGTGQAAIGGMQEDANVDSWAKRRQAATKILSYIKGTAATVAGEAAVTLTGAGYDLAWTSVDAVARKHIGLAIGDAAAAGTLTLSGSATAGAATGSGTGARVQVTASGSATAQASTGTGTGARARVTASGSAQAAAATGTGAGLTVTDAVATVSGSSTAQDATGSGTGVALSVTAGGAQTAQSATGTGAGLVTTSYLSGSATAAPATGTGAGLITTSVLSGSATASAASGSGTGLAAWLALSGTATADAASGSGAGITHVSDTRTLSGTATAAATTGTGAGVAVPLALSGSATAGAASGTGSGTRVQTALSGAGTAAAATGSGAGLGVWPALAGSATASAPVGSGTGIVHILPFAPAQIGSGDQPVAGITAGDEARTLLRVGDARVATVTVGEQGGI